MSANHLRLSLNHGEYVYKLLTQWSPVKLALVSLAKIQLRLKLLARVKHSSLLQPSKRVYCSNKLDFYYDTLLKHEIEKNALTEIQGHDQFKQLY